MAVVFMTDSATGRCALFTEPNTTGNPGDVSAPRNAPLNNPGANLQYLFYHSDYDPMEVAFFAAGLVISHAAIPAGTGPGGTVSFNGTMSYGGYATSHVLFTHSLGYVPDFFLIVGGNEVHPGFPVQYDSVDGRCRSITAYATTTQIILAEYGVQTSIAMPAININYTLMVLREPPAPSGNVLIDFNSSTGIVTMAKGKFDSSRQYLQVVPGGTPFGFPLGRTIDLANGTFRSVGPDGTIRDVVPNTFRIAYGYDVVFSFGPDGNYNGTFTGDPSILVQAP